MSDEIKQTPIPQTDDELTRPPISNDNVTEFDESPKRGRPKTGRTPNVTKALYFPDPELPHQVDEFLAKYPRRSSFSYIIQQFLTAFLKQANKDKTTETPHQIPVTFTVYLP